MTFKLCMTVDSNLNKVHVGADILKVKPYIRCPGKMYCTYTVNKLHHSWPTLLQLKENHFTDIVISLGLNHCKLRDGGRSLRSAVSRLSEIFRQYGSELPGVRLYCVQVPPSLSRITTDNANVFNRTLSEKLQGTNVKIIEMPDILYDSHGLLKDKYARASETGVRTPEIMKLHLNTEGLSIITYWIIKAMRHASGKRLR